MGLSKTFVTVGNWIEKHFPEKMTAAEVSQIVKALETRYLECEAAIGDQARQIQALAEARALQEVRIAELEKKAEVVNSDLNKTKIMLLTQRQTAGR